MTSRHLRALLFSLAATVPIASAVPATAAEPAVGGDGVRNHAIAAAERRGVPPTPAEVRAATDAFVARHPRASATLRRLRATGGVTLPPPPVSSTPVLPANRVVALYGAPQMTRTIIGLNSPRGAATRLATQMTPYQNRKGRPAIGAFDLVATIATAGRGSDGLYRSRQADEVIATYLAQARKVGARLILDLQPGRSTFRAELAAVADWLLEPDVDLALDPEWNVGRRGVPGRTAGKVTARQVNAVAADLAEIVSANALPPKLLLVHQFRRGSIRRRAALRSPPGVQLVLNFDGIGSPRAKAAGYEALSRPPLFGGFSLFYRRDRPLMKPSGVLALEPEPDLLLYQ